MFGLAAQALVIAPPMVQYANHSLIEDAELSRLLADLATSDSAFASSLSADSLQQNGRVGILTGALKTEAWQASAREAAARLLRVSVFPRILGQSRDDDNWCRGMQEFAVFKAMYGTALVPQQYEAADFKLGIWVSSRRTEKSRDKLSKEKIKQLDDMGFVWNAEEQKWQQGIQKLEEYRSEKGDLLVRQSHVTSDGFKLGSWVSNRRNSRDKLSKEKIKQLDDMGFVWDAEERLWQQGIQKLEEYRSEKGDLLVRRSHVTSDGFKLGSWVHSRRTEKSRDKLSKEKIKQLDDMGFVWNAEEQKWQQGIQKLEEYRSEKGDLLVRQSHVTSDGFKLGIWVSCRRTEKSRDKLSKKKIKQLDDMGFVWDAEEHKWQQGIQKLEEYRSEKGDLLVRHSHVTSDGFKLGSWVNNRRNRRDKLSKEKIKQLDDMEFVWDAEEQKWQQGIQKLEEYRSEKGDLLVRHSHVTSDGFKLGSWVHSRRKRRDKLSKEKIKQLDDMEFVWNVDEHRWQQGIRKLEEYRSEKGDLLVPYLHVTSDGFKLGIWVSCRRTEKSRDKLSKEKIKQLDDMGFVWDVDERTWQHGIRKLEEYRSEQGDLLVRQSHVTSDGFKLGIWVSCRRTEKSRDKLSKEKIKQLDDMGFVWDAEERLWQQGIQKLEEYRSEKGDLLVRRSHVTSDGFKLGSWVHSRRTEKSRDKLSKEKIKQLDDMGFVWDAEERLWQQGIQKLEEYRSEKGDLLVGHSHVTSDGFKLGSWVSSRRKRRDKLSKEKIKQLDGMGFVWDAEE